MTKNKNEYAMSRIINLNEKNACGLNKNVMLMKRKKKRTRKK
jgi:hypothetical protein